MSGWFKSSFSPNQKPLTSVLRKVVHWSKERILFDSDRVSHTHDVGSHDDSDENGEWYSSTMERSRGSLRKQTWKAEEVVMGHTALCSGACTCQMMTISKTGWCPSEQDGEFWWYLRLFASQLFHAVLPLRGISAPLWWNKLCSSIFLQTNQPTSHVHVLFLVLHVFFVFFFQMFK